MQLVGTPSSQANRCVAEPPPKEACACAACAALIYRPLETPPRVRVLTARRLAKPQVVLFEIREVSSLVTVDLLQADGGGPSIPAGREVFRGRTEGGWVSLTEEGEEGAALFLPVILNLDLPWTLQDQGVALDPAKFAT